MSDKNIPSTMTAADLATLFGVDARTIHALAAKGVLNRDADRHFDVRRSIAAYLKFKSRPIGASLEQQKIRLTEAQAAKVEQQNAKAAGELVAADAVRRAWVETAIELRNSILAVPARVSANLGLDRSAAVDLENEIRLALETISDAPAVEAAPGRPKRDTRDFI